MTPPSEEQAVLEVAVIGGGPAALAFAETVSAHGVPVAVFDEQPLAGGQFLRQPPRAFQVDDWAPGSAYREIKARLARVEGLKTVSWFGGASVLGISRVAGGFELAVASAGGTSWPQTPSPQTPSPQTTWPHTPSPKTRRLLVATGAQELPAPFPGWTTPGVMTAGAVQTMLKSQGLLAGKRILFCGTHPLQLIAADQVVKAGGRVEAVVFAQPLSAMLGLLRQPAAVLANPGALAEAAAALARLRRAGVAVRFGLAPLRVHGQAGVEAVELQRMKGAVARPARLECDTLALCYGFTPQSELPRSLGAAFAWDEPYGGWRVLHDEWMRASLSGLFVAGEVTGVGGAEKASLEGAIAGLGILRELGAIATDEADQRARELWRRHRRITAFAGMLKALTAPPAALARMADPAAIVCRCEGVSGADLRQAMDGNVQVGRPNALKLLTRAGMGPCGGRNCEVSIVRLVAGAANRPPEPADSFTPRFPARATPVRHLI